MDQNFACRVSVYSVADPQIEGIARQSKLVQTEETLEVRSWEREIAEVCFLVNVRLPLSLAIFFSRR